MLAAAAILIAAVSGCGAAHVRASRGALSRGRAVFARSCSGCHTLTGRDAGTEGPDLATMQMSIRDLASFTRVMPVHLSADEIDAVAAYVHAVAERHGAG